MDNQLRVRRQEEFPLGHTFGISRTELAARRQRIMAEAAKHELAGFVFFNALNIFYLTGFDFAPTERPMALVLSSTGRTALLVPRLEVEHAETYADVERISTYREYPGDRHPMEHLRDLLTDFGLADRQLGADSDGYGRLYGYRGPALSAVCRDASVKVFSYLVEEMRFVKSPAEIELIKESARWGNLAHMLLQKYSRDGEAEVAVANRASHEATAAMLGTLGPTFRPGGMLKIGAIALFRGQIGKNSYFPHAVTENLVMRTGDTLVTGALSYVAGYKSELERTMFVGEPSAEQQKHFELMCQMQEVAFDTIKPGIPCSAVDREVMRFVEEHHLMPYWRHHTGHALGLELHEAPFFDTGDETILQPGMVFSVEPGLYVEGLGGFRHSDTIVVTETGMELLSYYPRHLEALICG